MTNQIKGNEGGSFKCLLLSDVEQVLHVLNYVYPHSTTWTIGLLVL